MDFKIEKKLPCGRLGRAGVLATHHGIIETPAFVVVGTKATVKALTPTEVKDLGAQVLLTNTYHLYLEPGEEIMKKAGGLHSFMNWNGPTMTDSGGFQVFSLGADFNKKVGKISGAQKPHSDILDPPERTESRSVRAGNIRMADKKVEEAETVLPLAKIDEDGVTFKSVIDGSTHRFTPERSMEIQHAIGADMIFAFDECTSPEANYEYQKEAMDRTHRWAARCLGKHREFKVESEKFKVEERKEQALFGIVQGGRFPDLRKESAKTIGKMDFDGFGIGGSFDKKDMGTAVRWVNELIPPEKPRHLLGIGEPLDLFEAVENGCDLFDCVAPTRLARNGALYTFAGRINILNARFVRDFSPIDSACGCYACKNFTRAYLAHLFRAGEILANTLASIHNLYFIVNWVKGMRKSILEKTFEKNRDEFLRNYKS